MKTASESVRTSRGISVKILCGGGGGGGGVAWIDMVNMSIESYYPPLYRISHVSMKSTETPDSCPTNPCDRIIDHKIAIALGTGWERLPPNERSARIEPNKGINKRTERRVGQNDNTLKSFLTSLTNATSRHPPA